MTKKATSGAKEWDHTRLSSQAGVKEVRDN